jgi:hypothetical protein
MAYCLIMQILNPQHHATRPVSSASGSHHTHHDRSHTRQPREAHRLPVKYRQPEERRDFQAGRSVSIISHHRLQLPHPVPPSRPFPQKFAEIIISMEERTSQRAYQYAKLRYDDSLSVLPLEPSTDSTAPLRATLQECRLHHDIDLTPDGYEAISYVWGAPLFSEDLMIDGRPKAITPN